ncbi:HlyD family type I secretion periplasmic adaptor subunit [Pararobbsia silviterrae]|uniref:Membrane fusion protein (MFP) family protein n=1 Tax=Pararobbsia silviterrae TaxID=1792498 RepID=A0A494Y1L8_9BURK|nr:HlyD family type I secretion periplasmic adaptor subunit [Pararobbsia silviterrae]RKP56665.1 HlyD family type I secretion periplasmic adaptor subunit [Pararobbsia silviterrae]
MIGTRTRHRIRAWLEWIRRYRRVWRVSWRRRAELDPPALRAHEAEFLPDALAIQNAPISPVGRWVARVLTALVAEGIAGAVFGRVDIIVNAQGRLIADGYTKTLGSTEVASVHALHVEEGQTVRAGQVLIELDTRMNDSERDKAEGERQAAELLSARSDALLRSIDSMVRPRLPAIEGIDVDRRREAQRHLMDQWRDYAAKRARIDADIRRVGEALAVAAEQATDYAALARSHDVSRHACLDKEQVRGDLERQLDDAKHRRAVYIAESRKAAEDVYDDARRRADAARQDVARAQARGALLRLTAPVDGTVQQLAVHTVGGVVAAAQPLMQIVPAQTHVEIEAFIENKDAGFVHEGQHAEFRVDAFEYTKYGTVSGVVRHVSHDAIEDDRRGLMYSIHVALDRSDIAVQGRRVALTPGMTGTVEIRTGTRRIIEYVLAPLFLHARESLHER